jgi:hypothetical protein
MSEANVINGWKKVLPILINETNSFLKSNYIGFKGLVWSKRVLIISILQR